MSDDGGEVDPLFPFGRGAESAESLDSDGADPWSFEGLNVDVPDGQVIHLDLVALRYRLEPVIEAFNVCGEEIPKLKEAVRKERGRLYATMTPRRGESATSFSARLEAELAPLLRRLDEMVERKAAADKVLAAIQAAASMRQTGARIWMTAHDADHAGIATDNGGRRRR